ncbi:MAG: tol-pal system-associated acyl-CoA thioesterase [Gammaproteobacteria bacterium]
MSGADDRPAGGARPVFHWPVRVYYEDTDALGVVYNANYLRFLERARTEWLRARGHDQGRLAAEAGLGFIVVRVEVDFLRPARLDDCLDVSVAVAERRRASFTLAQEIARGGQALVRAVVQVACVDARTLRPRRLPDMILAELEDAF